MFGIIAWAQGLTVKVIKAEGESAKTEQNS